MNLRGRCIRPTADPDFTRTFLRGFSTAASKGTVSAGGGITVPTDGPTGVYTPLSSADWTQLSLPAPLYQWNCQEASGNLASAIGSLTLTATGTGHVYAQAVAGWTRTFVGFSTETANARFSTTDASLDAGLGQSVAWLIYASSQVAGTSPRIILQPAAAPNNSVRVTTTVYSQTHAGVVASSAISPALATVVPILWYRNATTNASGMYVGTTHIAGTHDETAYTATTTKGIGTAGATCAICRVGLAATWLGANAEAIAVAGTLTTLGWV